MDGEGGRSVPRGLDIQRKLEPTDVIMSSSHAKKLAFFYIRISSLGGINRDNFSSI